MVVLSPSVYAAELSEELIGLPVPMVALESSAFTRLGLTGLAWKRDVGPADQRYREVVITQANHPLAAGLSGEVAVLQKSRACAGVCPATTPSSWRSFPGRRPARARSSPTSAAARCRAGGRRPGGSAYSWAMGA